MPKGKYWTEDELEFLEKNVGKFPVYKIAARMEGRTPEAVQAKIFREARNSHEMHGYMNLNDISREYGCSRERVARLVREGVVRARRRGKGHGDTRWLVDPNHLKPIEHILRIKKDIAIGERAGRSKLKEVDVKSILKRHRNGETVASLATEHNVSWNAVWCAVTGRSWKHIQPKEWWQPR